MHTLRRAALAHLAAWAPLVSINQHLHGTEQRHRWQKCQCGRIAYAPSQGGAADG